MSRDDDRLVIVTATSDESRAARCIESWTERAASPCETFLIENGGRTGEPYLGVVPAFRRGIDQALKQTTAEVICAFHDDLEILEDDWDLKVLRHFDRQPTCGLAGFGGAIGLGDDDLYRKPYDPMQLARIGFRSNMRNAEAHGARSLLTERVACLDGFSHIGKRNFWLGHTWDVCRPVAGLTPSVGSFAREKRPFTYLEQLGIVHHLYDGLLGCLAARYGWETWYLPVACHHYGGQTAVGDPGYQEWAKTKMPGGDHDFWEAAHRIGYETFRDVLPLRV